MYVRYTAAYTVRGKSRRHSKYMVKICTISLAPCVAGIEVAEAAFV